MTTHKILDTQWIGDIGIVTIDDGYKIKTYCKQVEGLDEDNDIHDVITNGAKLYKTQLEALLYLHNRCHETEQRKGCNKK